MDQRKEQIKAIIARSKQRVQWAFNYIKQQPNFRYQVLPKMADLYKFFTQQIVVNLHPQFWKKHHRVFQLQKQQMEGRQLEIARNIIRAIDDYKQYLLQLLKKSKQQKEKEKKQTPTERGVFRKQEEQAQQTQQQSNIDQQIQEAVDDDTREYGHLYGKRKRYYGNYYQEYGEAKKKKTSSAKPKKIDYYAKSKSTRKTKSPWVKHY